MERALQEACDILVVEDDDTIRSLLSELLVEAGHRVAAVPDGRAALNYLQQSTTRPGLILLDLMMPVMSGWEFRAAQQMDPDLCHIPVIVLSAVSEYADARQRFDLDALAWVPKPIHWARLQQTIANMCPFETE